ncbi:c-type cytochrome [Pelagibius marinus]|uniref:c-type cytochrome n=1 Tax=Pelagibius marinus TaxID=2762760 RepID=UPI0029CA0A07|nr:c-type cytochrome [Pelagibius marinus]
MQKSRVIVIAVAVLIALGAAAAYTYNPFGSGGGAGMDPGDRDKVALGAQVYAANCASCHGAELEGQPDWRQRRADGRLPAPPHDVNGHTWHHPEAQLFALTKYGPAALAGGGYESDMPGYEGTLSDEEIWAVLSYIKSRWPREVRARHDQMSQQ